MKTATSRLSVAKTYKLYIGGAFPRSESGRFLSARDAKGNHLANYSHASRKDFRDAVVKARGAFEKWSATSAYLRGQILYRAAEMLESRVDELIRETRRATGATEGQARKEVESSIDALVHYAGWSDKFSQIASSVNPVASSHFNFSFPEATGVVTAFCPDEPALLGLVSLMAPAIISGNAVILIASERHPIPSVVFAEILATSDLPGGVVNILTGVRKELASPAAQHMDVNAIVDGSRDSEIGKLLQSGASTNLKRTIKREISASAQSVENPYWILETTETKTAWHPIGV